MARQYTVYCKSSAGELTPGELADGILPTDVRATAAADGVDSDYVESAIQELVVENTDETGFNLFRVCYLPDRELSIDVNQWPPNEDTFIPVIYDVERDNHFSRAEIKSHLEQTVSVVEINFGSSTREHMAPVFARAAAVCIATWFDGLVKEPDESWWEIGSNVGYRPLIASSPGSSPRRPVAVSKFQPKHGWRKPPPVDCPQCRKPLYGGVIRRKDPGLSTIGKLLIAAAGLVATVTYIGMAIWVRDRVFIPMKILGLILFPIALIPGIAVAAVAYRLPKVLRASCRKCGWSETFVFEKR